MIAVPTGAGWTLDLSAGAPPRDGAATAILLRAAYQGDRAIRPFSRYDAFDLHPRHDSKAAIAAAMIGDARRTGPRSKIAPE